MENTLKDLPGVLEVKAGLVGDKIGEAEVLYNPDQATTEGLRDAVPGASGERHDFMVVSVEENLSENLIDARATKMASPVCPTCGCSLVRLGISEAKSFAYGHGGQEYRFCCKGCADIFISDPGKYLEEVDNLRVCPTCLGEKPLESTVKVKHGGRDLYFCRCPHCVEEFKKNPDYFLKRLEGVVD